MGKLQGGVLPPQGLLLFQPLGQGLQQHLLLLGVPFRLQLSLSGRVQFLGPAVQVLPGVGQTLQGLAALQQGRKFGGGVLAGFYKGVALFHSLGQNLPLPGLGLQGLLLSLQLLAGGGGLIRSGFGPNHLFPPFSQPALSWARATACSRRPWACSLFFCSSGACFSRVSQEAFAWSRALAASWRAASSRA